MDSNQALVWFWKDVPSDPSRQRELLARCDTPNLEWWTKSPAENVDPCFAYADIFNRSHPDISKDDRELRLWSDRLHRSLHR